MGTPFNAGVLPCSDRALLEHAELVNRRFSSGCRVPKSVIRGWASLRRVALQSHSLFCSIEVGK